MKNSRNTRDSSNKGQQDSFMFPERDDDTYFELPPEDDDYYGASDDGSDDGYDSFVDEYDQEVKPQSKRQEQRREKKQVKALSEKQPKGVKNREILVVMYAFICIFLATIGYFIYYNAVESKDVINRPGNVHIAQLQEKTSVGVFWRLTDQCWPRRLLTLPARRSAIILMPMCSPMWWGHQILTNPVLRRPVRMSCSCPT